MRILTVIDSLNLAGAEALIKDTVPRIISRGVDVTLAVLKEIPDSPFEREMRDKGIPFLPTAPGGIYSPAHVFSLARHIKKFDLVHVRLFPALLWVPLARRLSGERVPLVMSADTTAHNREKLPFDKEFEHWMHSQYAVLAAASDGIAEYLKAQVPKCSDRVRVVWNGINIQRFENAQSADRSALFDNQDPILIYTARFHEQKDHSTLLCALAATNRGNLLLVGDGPLRDAAEALATTLNVTRRVRFLGQRPDVPELLKASDIYVHAPLFEGFGIAVIEAMAAGLPVIASDVPGLAQVVADNGVLVPPQDASALAAAIQRLLDSPEQRRQFAQKSVRRAADFDIQKTADGYVAIYEEVLSAKIPRR
jgi:glycosyltransferase involved in cell wall biosynthesis